MTKCLDGADKVQSYTETRLGKNRWLLIQLIPDTLNVSLHQDCIQRSVSSKNNSTAHVSKCSSYKRNLNFLNKYCCVSLNHLIHMHVVLMDICRQHAEGYWTIEI